MIRVGGKCQDLFLDMLWFSCILNIQMKMCSRQFVACRETWNSVLCLCICNLTVPDWLCTLNKYLLSKEMNAASTSFTCNFYSSWSLLINSFIINYLPSLLHTRKSDDKNRKSEHFPYGKESFLNIFLNWNISINLDISLTCHIKNLWKSQENLSFWYYIYHSYLP